jgi:hypothetical protein
VSMCYRECDCEREIVCDFEYDCESERAVRVRSVTEYVSVRV